VKILLDECIDRRLARDIAVGTVHLAGSVADHDQRQ
jgi:hypothetical protein